MEVVYVMCGLVGLYYVFNPYMWFSPRSNEELWKTRERSYGHPYYWKMRYDPKMYVHHVDAYNRHPKMRYNYRNVMYIE